MERYRIGRIRGRWKNFVPPIQGGIFGHAHSTHASEDQGLADAQVPELVEASDGTRGTESSHGSSRAASPVFDTATPARNLGAARSPETSTVSSGPELEEESMDGITYLDSLTRKQISLDRDKYPPLDGDTQAVIVEKYRELGRRLKAQGFYRCNYNAYAVEATRYALLISSCCFLVHVGWYKLAAVCLGLFWHQLAFVAHDAGHMGITHDFVVDSIIGIFIADFCGGLSLGWWKWSHNVHHIVTNLPEHDPDNQHLPFLAVSHRFFESLWSTYHDRLMPYDGAARRLTRVQAWLYYPVLALGRFNLYLQSWIYVFGGVGPKKGPAWWHRWLEVVGMSVFWVWFGYLLVYRSIPTAWDRVAFVIISNAVTLPLHVQITVSHFAMSTSDLGPTESFPQKMLRTTMDVDCPSWLDFVHGGLQFQVIHHLFPRIPRHNLRAAQKLVQGFCDDVGIPYALYGFVAGNKKVVGHLAEVSRQGAILAKCHRTLANRGELFHAGGH
jgi:sphingolipid 8-(E)-desaturase